MHSNTLKDMKADITLDLDSKSVPMTESRDREQRNMFKLQPASGASDN
jgi:hypothetical protein